MITYYQKNKEKILEQTNEYRLKNIEKIKERQKKHYLKNKEKIKERQKKYCLKNKEKIKERQKKYRSTESAKEIHNKWKKQWRLKKPPSLKDREKKKIYAREYRNNPKNFEKMKEWRKKYWLKNKEIILKKQHHFYRTPHGKATRQKYESRRYRTDINFKLIKLLRGRIRDALRGKASKSASTMKLVGCTIDELRKHLETQFVPGMTWKNNSKSGWHIDHIIPCSSFDLTDPRQQQICCNWSNLQPLWAFDNLSKGTKVISGDITSSKL